jgi:hypothetical protein
VLVQVPTSPEVTIVVRSPVTFAKLLLPVPRTNTALLIEQTKIEVPVDVSYASPRDATALQMATAA